MFDALFVKEYHRKKYNCAHFLADAWQVATGQALPDCFDVLLMPRQSRTVTPEMRSVFVPILRPETPCIAIMSNKGQSPHVGLFYDGHLLHINEYGVALQPLEIASVGFAKVRFYKCR